MPGHLIRRLQQISNAVFADRMAVAGLSLTSVQFAALATIARQPGIDQATLAAEIAYDRATIGGVVDRLVAKGAVHRQVSATDRRARVLAMTDGGAALLSQARPVVAALQDDILAGLSAEERATLLALLHKTTAAGTAQARAGHTTARPASQGVD